MRQVPDDEHDAWVRAMRERARLDAEALVPRPGHPVYGIAAPPLGPAALIGHSQENGESTSVTLAYGAWDSQHGPYAQVITAVADAGAVPSAGSTTIDGEHGDREPGAASLRFAVEQEHGRPAQWSDDPAPAAGPEPPSVISRESLPAGEALVCRSGPVWAACLIPADADADADPDADASVVVTIIGRGVEPEEVLLEPVTDLRPMVDARNEIIDARLRRARQRPRPPLPELEPAEGVAALVALAEHTLAEHRETRAAPDSGRPGRRELGSGLVRSLLWQRAVSEHQRLRGSDQHAADDAVTVAVNHLGFLRENAPWFEADPRLRDAAVDETARHAMLAEPVPSAPAQRAWARYWSARSTRLPLGDEHADVLAWMAARQALTDDCLRAWASWTETAG